MKDERVRYRPAEKRAVVASGVRAFCLARQDLPAEAMAQLFIDHIASIERACLTYEHGLFIVTRSDLRRVDLGGG